VQIKVDPADGKTVSSWLQDNTSVIAVAESTDFGQTWKTVVANRTKAGTDKDILVANGHDLYAAHDHSQTVWASYSHDGGNTFTSVKVNPNAQFGWSLSGAAAHLIMLETFISVGKVTPKWPGQRTCQYLRNQVF